MPEQTAKPKIRYSDTRGCTCKVYPKQEQSPILEIFDLVYKRIDPKRQNLLA